jgi:hypothetical protein
MPTTIRLLVISDTHSTWPYTPSCFAPPYDILIHCDDPTQVGGLPTYKNAMQDIQTIDAELKHIIADNHDLDLDEEWLRKNAEEGEEEEDIKDSSRCVEFVKSHEKDGVYYLAEGRHEFKLKDGREFMIWVSPYTPEFSKNRPFRDTPYAVALSGWAVVAFTSTTFTAGSFSFFNFSCIA